MAVAVLRSTSAITAATLVPSQPQPQSILRSSVSENAIPTAVSHRGVPRWGPCDPRAICPRSAAATSLLKSLALTRVERKIALSSSAPPYRSHDWRVRQRKCGCMCIARRVSRRISVRAAAGSDGGSGPAPVTHHQTGSGDVNGGGEGRGNRKEGLGTASNAENGEDGSKVKIQNGSQPFDWYADVDSKDEFKGWLAAEKKREEAEKARRWLSLKGIAVITGSVLLAAGLGIASYGIYKRRTYGARMPTPTVTSIDLQAHPGLSMALLPPSSGSQGTHSDESAVADQSLRKEPASEDAQLSQLADGEPVQAQGSAVDDDLLKREGGDGATVDEEEKGNWQESNDAVAVTTDSRVDTVGSLPVATPPPRPSIADDLLASPQSKPVASQDLSAVPMLQSMPATSAELTYPSALADSVSSPAPVDVQVDVQGQEEGRDGDVLSSDQSKLSSSGLSAAALQGAAAEDADSEQTVLHRAGSVAGWSATSVLPAPSAVSLPSPVTVPEAAPEDVVEPPAAVQTFPEVIESKPRRRVVVPAVVDPIQGQAFEALQILKVIDADADPAELCSRREYARWLINASTVLKRKPEFRVLPAMFIEGLSTLAFDDVSPEDPDFPHIQGLAEAGIISSKLSREDLGCDREAKQLGCGEGGTDFRPDDALTREELINWKMALENRSLPLPDRQSLREDWGFIDSAKICIDALPAVAKDLTAGRRSAIIAAFGYTKRLEPHKPVTRAQVAAALATGELTEVVSEEMARIEAEAMATAAVQAAAVADALAEGEAAEKFAEDLAVERRAREMAELAVTVAAEDAAKAMRELEVERQKVEEERRAVLAEKEEVESAMEAAVHAKEEAEEHLGEVLSSKKEVESEKGWLEKEMEKVAAERTMLQKASTEAEIERQAAVASRKQAEAEKQSLYAARLWAESEARKAKEAALKLEAVKKRLQLQGRSVVVRKEDVVEVPVVAERNLDLGIGLEENEPLSGDKGPFGGAFNQYELKRKVEGALERFDEKKSNVIENVRHHVGSAAEATGRRMHDVKKAAGDAVAEMVSTVGSNVAKAKEKVVCGTKRVADECKVGATKLAGRFRGAESP